MSSPVPVRRLLVLDDDQLMRDLLEAVLSLEGYDTVLADTGEAAIRLLGSAPPFYAVLTDIHMPGLHGADLAGSLRQAMPPASLLVGMSGSTPAPEVRALFDAFLPKPFDAADLSTAVAVAQEQRASLDRQAALEVAGPAGAGAVLSAAGAPAANTGAATKVVAPLPPLDETVFQALMKIIPKGQLGQLYDMTLADIGKRHARMLAWVQEGDLRAAQREAHAIKGSCGMVGATELQFLAAAIEDGTTVDTAALQEIPAACLRLRRMLDGKLQTV